MKRRDMRKTWNLTVGGKPGQEVRADTAEDALDLIAAFVRWDLEKAEPGATTEIIATCPKTGETASRTITIKKLNP